MTLLGRFNTGFVSEREFAEKTVTPILHRGTIDTA
jgi:hypothetical protein